MVLQVLVVRKCWLIVTPTLMPRTQLSKQSYRTLLQPNILLSSLQVHTHHKIRMIACQMWRSVYADCEIREDYTRCKHRVWEATSNLPRRCWKLTQQPLTTVKASVKHRRWDRICLYQSWSEDFEWLCFTNYWLATLFACSRRAVYTRFVCFINCACIRNIEWCFDWLNITPPVTLEVPARVLMLVQIYKCPKVHV